MSLTLMMIDTLQVGSACSLSHVVRCSGLSINRRSRLALGGWGLVVFRTDFAFTK
jgi:hypothetical protein